MGGFNAPLATAGRAIAQHNNNGFNTLFMTPPRQPRDGKKMIDRNAAEVYVSQGNARITRKIHLERDESRVVYEVEATEESQATRQTSHVSRRITTTTPRDPK
jgi:hypothetical protein